LFPILKINPNSCPYKSKKENQRGEERKINQQPQKKQLETKNHKNTTVQCLLLCCSILIVLNHTPPPYQTFINPTIPQNHPLSLSLVTKIPVSTRITTTNKKKRNKQRETEGDETDRSKGKGDCRRQNRIITVHSPLLPVTIISSSYYFAFVFFC
jgi:hypothetical protein